MTVLLQKDKKYVSLDLEMNQPSNKIIQIGICIGSYDTPQKDWIKKYWYVNPQEPLNPEIIALTGITDFDVQNDNTPEDIIAQELSKLLRDNNVFVNPVTWGVGDAQLILKMFADLNIEFRHFGRRWIDVKTFHTFLQLGKGKSFTGGLKSVMGGYKLQLEGLAHRADVDAYNTLRLFFHLVERQSKLEALLQDSKNI
jgi:DNA polymerase III epsilon subunit-like protein